MGNIHPHRSRHMVLTIADGHPAGIQTDDHVINISQTPRALGNHRQQERSSPVSGYVYDHWPVVGINGL